ncbi:MAG: hypothetical protein ACD_9C00259G0002 [uncultured bacterium]|nr:MAG: hypothetical protein ACD_9C00259G0002 [uncultured bacterium]
MNDYEIKNMKKTFLFVPVFVFAALLFSGCSFDTALVSNKNTMANATFIKSEDGGSSWNPKVRIDDKKTIAGVDVLSIAINPVDSNVVYIGTSSNGLFVTKDGGENWTPVAFPDKAYGLIFDPSNPDIMYGSAVFNGRAKIFKRLSEGQEWKEIYTEPADGTTISALAIDRVNPQILYAGTSEGVIVKTTDAGATWVNLKKAEGPIIGIGFDSANDSHVFFGIFQVGVLETKNAGASIENITDKIDTTNSNRTIYSLVTDPYHGGVVYVGTEAGIFKRSGGETWNAMNLIESSKIFPIRSIAINPKNSKEIMYSSAKAIYKSIDGGATWSTFQLDTSKEISAIRYNLNDSSKIYAGLRGF